MRSVLKIKNKNLMVLASTKHAFCLVLFLPGGRSYFQLPFEE